MFLLIIFVNSATLKILLWFECPYGLLLSQCWTAWNSCLTADPHLWLRRDFPLMASKINIKLRYGKYSTARGRKQTIEEGLFDLPVALKPGGRGVPAPPPHFFAMQYQMKTTWTNIEITKGFIFTKYFISWLSIQNSENFSQQITTLQFEILF